VLSLSKHERHTEYDFLRVHQLCVRELELMNKIAVGRLATMDEILDLILKILLGLEWVERVALK